MARRKKDDGAGLGCVLLIAGLVIYGLFSWAADNKGVAALVVGLVVTAYLARQYFSARSARARHQAWVDHLNAKYGHDARIVDGILNREFWQGQTAEQLRDALGAPHGVDRQVMKSRTREVWKYHEQQKGRFRIKINLENDVVVGWDNKS